jgi:hypothetical protein
MKKKDIFDLLDEHFEMDMMMECVKEENERHYTDKELYIIFVVNMPKESDWNVEVLRILIRNWRTNNSFSKNVVIEFELSKEFLIKFIKEVVYNNSGIESRDLLNDWYEIKKVEIRDKKISDLGI